MNGEPAVLMYLDGRLAGITVVEFDSACATTSSPPASRSATYRCTTCSTAAGDHVRRALDRLGIGVWKKAEVTGVDADGLSLAGTHLAVRTWWRQG